MAGPVALIAGSGALPAALVAALAAQGRVAVVCHLIGQPVDDLPDIARLTFRLETLGTLMTALREQGVQDVCLAGAVARPAVDPSAVDAATAPLVPRIWTALDRGDDGALRIVIDLFEAEGFTVHAAHEIAPDLLPPPGLRIGKANVPASDLAAAMAAHDDLSRGDVGQAVIARLGRVVATEGPDGTDAMIAGLVPRLDGAGAQPPRGLLYKAPKTGQDRRADLPVIGPRTVELAAEARLAAIVIEAGGVMVVDRPRVEALIEATGLTLWVREP